MPKCDIVIEFDKSDRTFRAGETISGKVHVTANTDVSCDGVKIETAWSTHGRGNRDSGSIDTLRYDGEQFSAGQTVIYEFSFEAPSWPLTYHGHYLNVDHYVRIRLDVPWAFDPKAREEYLLLPGPACAPVGEVHGVTETGGSKKSLGCALLVAVVVALVSLGFGFFPVIAVAWLVVAVLGFMVFRNSLAARKLGEVAFHLDRHRAAPGERLGVSVDLSPGRPVSINKIAATLRGREEVVSGSGTDRTTHTKTLCKELFTLRETGQLPAGQQTVSGDILIPQTEAWTFHADDNKLVWDVTLRVDIPNWPDWAASAELELLPGGDVRAEPSEAPADELAPAVPVAPAGDTETTEASPGDTVSQTADEIEPADPSGEAEPPAAGGADSPTYAGDLAAIIGADRFSGEREDLIRQASQRTYDLTVTVKSASWTLESGVPSEYQNGRTVIANVEDTDGSEIAIHFPEDANDEIDALPIGTPLHVVVRLREFNTFYDRMEALAEQYTPE